MNMKRCRWYPPLLYSLASCACKSHNSFRQFKTILLASNSNSTLSSIPKEFWNSFYACMRHNLTTYWHSLVGWVRAKSQSRWSELRVAAESQRWESEQRVRAESQSKSQSWETELRVRAKCQSQESAPWVRDESQSQELKPGVRVTSQLRVSVTSQSQESELGVRAKSQSRESEPRLWNIIEHL